MLRSVFALCVALAFTNPIVSASAFAGESEQTIQSLLAAARDAQSSRDYLAAAESYRKATMLDPALPELWANLGLMYHEAGKSSEAIQSFREAIRLNPSLFVPQLFMGIEYIASKNPKAAIPYLDNAAKLNPKDPQVQLSLGKAYGMLDRGAEAAEFYRNFIQLAPNNGDAWLALGTSYLQQVEGDARLMTSKYGGSVFVNLRAGEVFAEEGKLIRAENHYKIALASPLPAPCAHSELGITLLREQKIAEAREQFLLETRTASHCALAPLGFAVAELAEGRSDAALKALTAISITDSKFVRLNLPLFRGSVTSEQAKSLIDLAQAGQVNGASTIDVALLIEAALLPDDALGAMTPAEESRPVGAGLPNSQNAEEFNADGQHSTCTGAQRPAINAISRARLQILASCSFYIGDFQTTSIAGQRLKADPATLVQGLYWESKADEKLAIAALSRAGEIGSNSPRMHVLIGDAFRQERRWDEAESEYRKAVALDPKSQSARLRLAIVLFTESKNDEAFQIDRSLLDEDPNDQEANLLAGEILVQRHLFNEAEPYLTRCTKLTPELVPAWHILLGKVYAATDRVPEAISEYKLGLSTDKDGSIHYQLGRLYQKSGDKRAAEQGLKDSKRIRSQWDDRARVTLEEKSTDLSRQ